MVAVRLQCAGPAISPDTSAGTARRDGQHQVAPGTAPAPGSISSSSDDVGRHRSSDHSGEPHRSSSGRRQLQPRSGQLRRRVSLHLSPPRSSSGEQHLSSGQGPPSSSQRPSSRHGCRQRSPRWPGMTSRPCTAIRRPARVRETALGGSRTRTSGHCRPDPLPDT